MHFSIFKRIHHQHVNSNGVVLQRYAFFLYIKGVTTDEEVLMLLFCWLGIPFRYERSQHICIDSNIVVLLGYAFFLGVKGVTTDVQTQMLFC